MLSLVQEPLIARFMVYYAFDVVEFLARVIRHRDIGGKKLLLAYSYIIRQLYFAARVKDLLGIY